MHHKGLSKVQGTVSASGSKISKENRLKLVLILPRAQLHLQANMSKILILGGLQRYGLLTLEIMKFPSGYFYSQPRMTPQKSLLVERQLSYPIRNKFKVWSILFSLFEEH